MPSIIFLIPKSYNIIGIYDIEKKYIKESKTQRISPILRICDSLKYIDKRYQ